VQEFRNLTNELTGVYGFYVVRLNNGASYGYNHRQVFDASTLIQLPAMVMVYRDDFDINGTYRLQSEDKTGSGPLQEEEVDTVWTYGELARYIGRENDEASYNIVLKELGEQNVQEFLRTNGISNTSLDKSTTTPKDVGTLLLKLWRREFVEQGARDELLENLKDSEFNQHLVAGVPSGVQVVHKFGEEVNAVVEAGIVYAHEPFVVVIMSEGVNMAEADEVFPELARLIWEFEGE
jgi:beta-lactamase class A